MTFAPEVVCWIVVPLAPPGPAPTIVIAWLTTNAPCESVYVPAGNWTVEPGFPGEFAASTASRSDAQSVPSQEEVAGSPRPVTVNVSGAGGNVCGVPDASGTPENDAGATRALKVKADTMTARKATRPHFGVSGCPRRLVLRTSQP